MNGSHSIATAVYRMAQILMGGIFIYASLNKIADPLAFARDIFNYQILPDSLINLTALVLPWLELCLGACLVFGVWLPGALFLMNALMMVFIGALGFNLARGFNVHCGCFGSGAGLAGKGEMAWSVARDLGMLAVSVWLFVETFRRGSKKDR